MKNTNIMLWGLVGLFAVLMSVPFIIPHTGFLALFGIVPYICCIGNGAQINARQDQNISF